MKLKKMRTVHGEKGEKDEYILTMPRTFLFDNELFIYFNTNYFFN